MVNDAIYRETDRLGTFLVVVLALAQLVFSGMVLGPALP